MAKQLAEILSTPTIRPNLELVVIKPCGNPNCKETISTHDGFEYLHSHLTDKFYCDAVCMSWAEERDIDFMDRDQVQRFVDEMEAVLCG